MRDRRGTLRLLLAMTIALGGCDSGSTGPGSDISGVWEGPFTFPGMASPTTIRFSLNHAGSTITGSWTNYFSNGSVDENGTISGSITGSAFAGIMRVSRPSCASAEAAMNGMIGKNSMTWSSGGFAGGSSSSCHTPEFSIPLTKK